MFIKSFEASHSDTCRICQNLSSGISVRDDFSTIKTLNFFFPEFNLSSLCLLFLYLCISSTPKTKILKNLSLSMIPNIVMLVGIFFRSRFSFLVFEIILVFRRFHQFRNSQ
ncbi:hypothetical protein OCU04_004562 [Sclerotinia nivalis]|uniref:Uncharacterized protein n=1 Tax=Sclerotinia nivalis TaxID=352851 RepID=A0A9X0AQP9_9HELO|nr:hypothetical protein OCU04_004562 [Sclerotinia nivalis]